MKKVITFSLVLLLAVFITGCGSPATQDQGKWGEAGGGERKTETNCLNPNIKGNISSSGEKIYHVPGGQYYGVTQIDPSKGERWFCSENEAISAGWRKSKR